MQRYKRIVSYILALLMVISIAFPDQIAQSIGKKLFVSAAMSVGGSGSITPGSPSCSISGIETTAYREPPMRVSIFRNKRVKLEDTNGLDKVYDNMAWGFPEWPYGCLYFLNQSAIDTISGKPVSVAYANTSNGTLDYNSSQDIIDNIIPLGGEVPQAGVYQQDIQAVGIEAYKQDWRSKMTKYDLSRGAWSYILAKVDGGYNVDKRVQEIFNRSYLDYNNIAGLQQYQIDEITTSYADMLMTLYTVAQGGQKEKWGQIIDDYLNGENLDESPISISIDSAALMTMEYDSYYILLPTIDYFNYYVGMDPAYQIDGASWWSGAIDESNWYKEDTYNQLKIATQKSVYMWPNYQRISDSFNRNNGFSFATTAFAKGMLTTSGGNAQWVTAGSAATDYLNIFKLSSPNRQNGHQYGYMLLPAPSIQPQLPIGSLSVEPKNKVIEKGELGNPVQLTISSGIQASDFGKWDSIIKSAREQGRVFDVQVDVQRQSNIVIPSMFEQMPVKLQFTPDEMLEFVTGTKTIPITERVERVQTLGNKEIKLDYTATITISSNGKKYTGTSSDYASFKILEPRIGYSSKPEAYSELKNYGSGSNMKGNLEEDWEAMAGVPSTEQLYFAAGGSEFIVEVSVEKVEDETAKRTYLSQYTGIECEFKQGDTMSVNQSSFSPGAGGTWVDNHIECDNENGGDWQIAASWSGQNPHTQNEEDCGTCGAIGYNPCTVDPTPFNNALAAANLLKSQLESENIQHTAASDKKTRTVHWSVVVSYEHDDTSNAKRASGGWGCLHGGCDIESEKHQHKGQDCDPGQECTKSHAWSISLVATIPAHAVCGPCCSHNLPAINDTWAQTFTYDSMKIADVHVWTIDQAAVNGLDKIVKKDVVGADIVKGRPNIFYNIALKNDANFNKEDANHSTHTSRAGRVRYSVDPAQHDTVVYYNGARTNKCDGLSNTYSTNVSQAGGNGHGESYATGFIYDSFRPGHNTSGALWADGQVNYPTDTPNFLQSHTDNKDKSTVEYNKFLSQRNQMVTPTMITDFLILQTSSGDQAVLYFDKSTPAVTAESRFNKLDVTKEEMWDNNVNSAAKWKDDHINVGGYNGKYKDPDSKFTWKSQGNQPKTVFDPDPAGTIIRPARPNTNLMLYQGELNIILDNKNKAYKTKQAEVFWKNTLHWVDKSSPRFAGVDDPQTAASFDTTMTTGEKTKFDFSGGDEVGTYTATNGLSLRAGTQVSGNTVTTNAAGQGVYGPYVKTKAGTYLVEVTGTNLTHGEPIIYDKAGAVNYTSGVTIKSKTDKKVVYTLKLDQDADILEYCWHAKDSTPMTFESERVSRLEGTGEVKSGYILKAPYSKSHDKINDIIIQDPVSTQDVSVVSLPDERDQRTGNIMGAASLKDNINQSQVCPRDPALCDFRTLHCTYLEDTVLADYDFKNNVVDNRGNPINKATKNSLMLTSGFSMSNGSLQARGTRLSIPFSELNLQYQSSTKIKAEADVVINKEAGGTMLFSFLQYDLYIPGNSEYATLNTGNGWERKSTIPLADGKKHHIEVIFSFNSVDSSRVIIDGKEGYERVSESKDVTSQIVGTNFNIGCWGRDNNYPARFSLDNLKITRLAGTKEHNEDCYKLVMTHPSGLNAHKHNENCLNGNGNRGAQWFINGVMNGSISDQQAHDILGNGYDPIMQNSFGPIIHTWSNWSAGSMYGFAPLNNVNLSTSGGDLIVNVTGRDPHLYVPVDIDAAGVTKIAVTLDNNTNSTSSQLYWSTNSGLNYSEQTVVYGKMKPNTNNQVVNFVVRGVSNWKDKITNLRFDPSESTGTVRIKKIDIYGGGTRTSSGSGGSGTVIFDSGNPGLTTKSLPAGQYDIQAWGAQGGTTQYGGKGGYVSGRLTLNNNTTVYINVGGQTGFNGGGSGHGRDTDSGGGASDVRVNNNNLDSRVIVAGGGGGPCQSTVGGYGGGLTGGTGGDHYGNPGQGGTQTSGGAGGTNNGERGTLGQGGSNTGGSKSGGGAGGGGYYGGGAGGNDYSSYNDLDDSGGGGGSSYTGGVTSASNIAGNASMPAPNGGTETGHSGNGHIKIISLFSPVSIRGAGNGGLVSGQVMNFGYTGGTQSMRLVPGRYKFETWGAQGGAGKKGADLGGKGGYSIGYYNVSQNVTAYINVGGKGGQAPNTGNGTRASGGFNGGGTAWDTAAGGGGATDIRVGSNNYGDVKIVAGGGGGTYSGSGSSNTAGGAGGGSVGIGGFRVNSSSNRLDNGGGAGSATGRQQYAFEPEDTRVYGSGGGGGGGYWGGRSGGKYGSYYGGGGGGSAFIGGVYSANTINGDSTMSNPYGGTEVGHPGNGYARITAEYIQPVVTITLSVNDIKKYWNLLPDKLPNGQDNPIWGCNKEPNIHVCDSKCGNVKTLVCTEPHHKGMHYDVSNKTCWQACDNDESHKQYKPTVKATTGEFKPGNFVNMDYGFQVYFANNGDFGDGEPYGIGSLTSERGKGYTDSLDTTKWTRQKKIKFDFNVIYQDKLYKAGEWIILGDRGTYKGKDGSKYDETKWSNYGTDLYDGISQEYYDFYCVLANYEAASASVKVEVEAVNCPGSNDNTVSITNKKRGKYSSLHGGNNTTYVDVVGRIGNLVIEDTGDYRFSNLFKTPKTVDEATKINLSYNTSNGLSLLGNGNVESGIVKTSETGSGATVEGVGVQEGAYRIDIMGTGLNNGEIDIEASESTGAKESWTGDEFTRQITTSSTKMSYYLTVPRDSNIDIIWKNSKDKAMEVTGIDVTWIGKSADEWVVDGVVQDTDETNQNYYLTWTKDIRGLKMGSQTNYLNTYSTLNWMDGNTKQLPLSSEKNSIDILKTEPLLVGYPIYFDISSLGNYWWNNASKVQVVPYYYALDVEKNEITPLDVYFKYDKEYKLINEHGLVTSGEWDDSKIFNYTIKLDWLGEKARRNYTDTEKRHTDFFRDFYAEGKVSDRPVGEQSMGAGATTISPKQLDGPGGSNYVLGNAQIMQATGKARTFIGGETTYGKLMNLGGSNTITTDEDGYKYNKEGRLEDYLWWQSAQRWHLKIGLPSSAVFIEHGKQPTTENLAKYVNDKYLILCTADIRVIGDKYALKYDQKEDNGSINIQRKDGKWSGEIKMPNNIPPVLAVYSTTKASQYDIDIVSSH